MLEMEDGRWLGASEAHDANVGSADPSGQSQRKDPLLPLSSSSPAAMTAAAGHNWR